MSARPTWTVHCDGSDIDGTRADGCYWWIAERDTAPEARRVAKANGWIRRDGRDLCPPCSALAAGSGTVGDQ